MWKSVLIALAEGWLYAQAAVEPVLVAGRVNPPEQGQAIYGVAEDVFGRPLLLQGDRISRIERDLSTSHVVSGFPIQAELNTTALDRAGRLYFRTLTGIRRQELTGQISVVAGEGPLPAADGRGARDASFRADAMTVTAGGELRWLAGSSLWRIDEAGRLRRLWQDPGDGAIRRIPFFDSNAAAYLAEGRNIFSVDQDGMRPFRAVEGEVAAAAFRPTGELVYSLAGDGRILEQDRNGFTRVLAGRTAEGFAAGCPADGEGFDAGTARFEHIRQLFPQRDGGLLIYEWTTQRVRRLSPDHVLFPLTKNAFGRIGDGGLAAEAVLNGADDVAAGPDGLIYIADTNHNRIRRVRENGSIETVLGGTGAAACAEPLEYLLDRPKALAFLPSGDLLVVDSGNDRILRRTPDGRVFKFGTSDRFYRLTGIGVDRHGTVYVADGLPRIHRFTSSGQPLTPIAGVRGRAFTQGADGELYLTAEGVGYRIEPDGQLSNLGGEERFQTRDPGANTPSWPALPTDEPGLPAYSLLRGGDGLLYMNGAFSEVTRHLPACAEEKFRLVRGGIPVGTGKMAPAKDGWILAVEINGRSVFRFLPPPRGEGPAKQGPRTAERAAIRNAASRNTGVMMVPVIVSGMGPTQLRPLAVSSPVSANEWVEISGQCLGPELGMRALDGELRSPPLELGGIRVFLGEDPLALLEVQAGRVVAITPNRVPSGMPFRILTNQGDLIIHSTTTNTAPALIPNQDANGTRWVMGFREDGSEIQPENGLREGERITLLATGLGPMNEDLNGYRSPVSIRSGPLEAAATATPDPDRMGIARVSFVVEAGAMQEVDLVAGGAAANQRLRLPLVRRRNEE